MSFTEIGLLSVDIFFFCPRSIVSNIIKIYEAPIEYKEKKKEVRIDVLGSILNAESTHNEIIFAINDKPFP